MSWGALVGAIIGFVVGCGAPCGPVCLWMCGAPCYCGDLGIFAGACKGGAVYGASMLIGGLCECLGAVAGGSCHVCANAINCVGLLC